MRTKNCSCLFSFHILNIIYCRVGLAGWKEKPRYREDMISDLSNSLKESRLQREFHDCMPDFQTSLCETSPQHDNFITPSTTPYLQCTMSNWTKAATANVRFDSKGSVLVQNIFSDVCYLHYPQRMMIICDLRKHGAGAGLGEKILTTKISR